MTGPAVPGDDELREALAEALIGQPVVRDFYTVPITPRDAHLLADALLPVVRRWADQRAAEELRAAAKAWSWSAWADTPRHADRAVDRIGAAQYVTDWLRARADALDPEVSP